MKEPETSDLQRGKTSFEKNLLVVISGESSSSARNEKICAKMSTIMTSSVVVIVVIVLEILFGGDKERLGGDAELYVSAYTYTTAGLNIFVRVRPCAMGHEVGAVCTWNGWRSEGISRGWWVKNLPDNEEIWRINIGYNEFCEDLWFSVYVRDSAGREAWDSNDGWNYTLNLLVLNTTTYDTSHPAVLQYEQNKNNGNHFDEDNAEVCEEQWLNVNHVSCC